MCVCVSEQAKYAPMLLCSYALVHKYRMEQVPELVQVSKRTSTNQSFDGSRVPITILTGFLGSGKSTLLNEILTRKDLNTRFAVIMNEFGDSNTTAIF